MVGTDECKDGVEMARQVIASGRPAKTQTVQNLRQK